jgi:hypothetical protein
VRVELDRDDAPRGPRELRGQPAGSGAELDHEVVRADAGIADHLRRDGTAKEVLTRSAPWTARGTRAPLGHEPSP